MAIARKSGSAFLGMLCMFNVSMTVAVTAQTSLDPESIEFSPIMRIIVAEGINQAAEQLAPHFYENAVEDEIVIANMSENDTIKLAGIRAQKVYGYLQADLNWDGQVTEAELVTYFAQSDQGFVAGYLRDGDLDGDGVITLTEMHADAGQQINNSSPASNGYVAEMLTWDLDQDGILVWDEVVQVLLANQP